MDLELASSLAVSLAVGLLIGLERQMAIEQREGREVLPAGVRTFPLIALAGSTAVLLEPSAPWAIPAVIFCLAGLLAAHRLGLPMERREAGFTTDVAAIVTLLLGALAVSRIIPETTHRLLMVAGLSVVVTLLLSVKPRLHAAIRRLSVEDIYATLQLLLVALVILPLLPDRTYGPYEAIHPQQIGRFILLLGSVSFVGYVASRLLGPGRGLVVTGLVGGLVSSTAVTFSMARRARADENAATPAVVATVAASAMMFLRVLFAAAVVHPPLVPRLLVPLLAMAVIGGFAIVRLRAQGRAQAPGAGPTTGPTTDGIEFRNPFELKSAVIFGLLFGGVIFVSKAVQAELGSAALYVTGVLAGTTDVDAITLSAASLARDGLDLEVASTTIFFACVSNTAVKAGIAYVSGGRAFGAQVARIFGATIAAGAFTLLVAVLIGE